MKLLDFKQLGRLDKQILIYVLGICIVGLATVFSTTYFPNRNPSELFFNQIAFYLAGFVAMISVTLLNYKALLSFRNQFIIFILNIGLLILVLAIGDTVFDAKRWINLGSFSLQPSEIAKVVLVLNIAYIFSKFFKKKEKSSKTIAGMIVLILVVIIPVGLTLMQNSLGNAVLLSLIAAILFYYRFGINIFFLRFILFILLGVLSVSGLFQISSFNIEILQSNLNFDALFFLIILIISIVSMRLFQIKHIAQYIIFCIFGLFIGIISFPLLNYFYNNNLQQYQRNRIENFINPKQDSAEFWNKEQSMIACGSGGIFGKGFLQGTQSSYGFLPFSHTDFAYCGFVEQFGFFGSSILLALYALLFIRILYIADRTEEMFGKVISNGMLFVILLNMFQHIGMNLGVLPITGVPLPLVSYGGSSILTVFIALGFVQSVNANKTNKMPKVRVIERI